MAKLELIKVTKKLLLDVLHGAKHRAGQNPRDRLRAKLIGEHFNLEFKGARREGLEPDMILLRNLKTGIE